MAKAAKAIKMMGSPMAEQAAENTRQWLKWLPVGNHPKNHALMNAVQTASTWKTHSDPLLRNTDHPNLCHLGTPSNLGHLPLRRKNVGPCQWWSIPNGWGSHC